MDSRLIARGTLIVLSVWIGSVDRADAADRPSPTILGEINAITIPSSDSKDSSDPKAARDFEINRQKIADQKGKLILELFKSYPTHPELARLMPERWRTRPQTTASALASRAEIDQIVLKSKNMALVAEASYYKALLAIKKAGPTPKLDEVLPAIDDFIKRFPKDPRGGDLLYQAAIEATDKEKQSIAFDRIQKNYPDSSSAKQVAAKLAGPRVKEDWVGKPFDLEFTEAIKGSQVSMASLKGKVVVIDFWATWCGPCVAEMPKMKKLYAEYKDKGVEFIGVSLDRSKADGGLDSLKAFVAKEKIEWPQYFQGNYWGSEFSKGWGINSIPCVFLIDADGRLASVEARGKLETLIPKALEKAKTRTEARSASNSD